MMLPQLRTEMFRAIKVTENTSKSRTAVSTRLPASLVTRMVHLDHLSQVLSIFGLDSRNCAQVFGREVRSSYDPLDTGQLEGKGETCKEPEKPPFMN